MDEIENLGKRLKELRNQRGLTLDMVVFDCGRQFNIEFSKGNLSRWENGINYPSIYYAAYLAKYYGVSVDYLIGNTTSKVPVDLLLRNKENKDGKSGKKSG